MLFRTQSESWNILFVGKLVLDALHLPTEVYYASEVDTDCITISSIRQKDIIHLGDIRNITAQTVNNNEQYVAVIIIN